MLVLTRKVGEGIAIGDDVRIIVMQVKGKQVRLGIKASPNTVVHREEVYKRIQEENRSASTSELDVVNQAQDILGKRDGIETSPKLKKREISKKKDGNEP